MMKTVVYQDVLENLEDLETALTAIDERRLLSADSILIYLNGAQWTATSSGGLALEAALDNARQQARNRLTGTALYFAPDPTSLCALGADPRRAGQYKPLKFEYLDTRGAAFSALSDEELVALTAQAMCAAIEGGLPRCVVHAPTGQHFELPSKSHASHFIRLSEAFDCIDAVQRVAYWIVVSMIAVLSEDDVLPERAFLVDHPTMLLLGVHVNLIYGGKHQVVTLKGYPSESALRTEASKLLQTMKARSVHLTAVIGIASTGKLAKTLNELAVDNATTLDVCLVFSPLDMQDGPKPLARLEIPEYLHSIDAAACEKCGQGAPPPIQVHSRSFLLSLAPAVDVALKPAYFNQQRPFIDTYGAVPGALRIHFDDSNEVLPRHHAFGIDVPILLANPSFLREVVSKLRSLDPKPDFVVIPDHKASAQLRKTIAAWDGLNVVTLDNLAALRNSLPAKPTVLVFDDKVVSGQRLRNINGRLREPRPHLWDGFNHVHFFAPVVTTRSKKQLDDLEKGLTTRVPWSASFHHLYCLHLPDWHAKADCPWCKEEKLLELLASESSGFDSPLTSRLTELDAEVCLGNMDCLTATPGEVKFPTLGMGSIAANSGSSQLQVLFATASAVQQLRTDLVKPLDPHSVTLPTRMARFVFEDAFTEKLIACSILRSVDPVEVSNEMKDYLINALRHPANYEGASCYQMELAIALLTGKMGTVNSIGAAWDVLLKYGVSDASLRKLGFVKT